ncbi:MAG: ABC transporter [Treponema sp. CETP13]|nr:MAG: ABC transporter [Treponema sp. CETP13]
MKKHDRRDIATYCLFVIPGLLIYLLIVAYPIVYSVLLSFSDFNPNRGGKWNFTGLVNYKNMITNPAFWNALKNNMIIVAVSLLGQIPIGFLLAFILYRKRIKGRSFFQSMVFLPQFLSTIVIGILWRMLFSADGPVSGLMQWISGNPEAQCKVMLNKSTAMIPIAIALIWMYTGMYMIIFLANLQKIDDSMLEAAKIDGATEGKIFRSIVMPLLAGTILISAILAIAGSLKSFALIYAIAPDGLVQQNVEVLSVFMYRTAFNNYSNPLRYAFGAAISNTIVLISALMIVLSKIVGKKLGTEEEY